MQADTARTLPHASSEEFAPAARGIWNRIRPIAFWVSTLVIVAELAAGSVWNLLVIEWVDVQLRHLGYPLFFAYILGAGQVGAAVAIILPRFPLLKEWAYAGVLFLWSGAVVSHLLVGDGPASWGPPLMFAMCAIASWALRPADRRLPGTWLPGPDRPANAGRDGAGPAGTGLRAWAVPVGILVVLYAVSLLTLPAAEAAMHEQAVERGWIEE